MQHVTSHLTSAIPAITQSRGGRISSPELRRSHQFSEEFPGLEKDTNRYDLLLLVKRAGKSAGFSSKMIQLLDYYMAFTRETDWEEGARPIVYQSQSKTALDLGVSERHIQRLEQALFAAKALTWNDSGNHRRFGQRCPKSGVILYAYGVDLTPLASLKPELEAKLHEKELHDRAWMETKRQISYYRRQICAVIAEGEEGANAAAWVQQAAAKYETLAVSIRTYMSLATLRSLLAEHKALYQQILSQIPPATAPLDAELTGKESSKDDQNVAHYNSTNQESSDKSDTRRLDASCFRECDEVSFQKPGTSRADRSKTREEGPIARPGSISGTGLHLITPKQARNAASERFRDHIPMASRAMNWNDLVEAAYRLKPELHISQDSWAEACHALSREGAAIALLLTDQAIQRAVNPVRKPGAYFRAMTNRAKTGELNLHSSLLGILKREGEINQFPAHA